MKRHLVLIVEDDSQLGDTVVDILQMLDFDTELVTNGLYVISKMSERTPDVVLLDLNLPGKSGFDVLNDIRTDARFKDVKVIVLTADALRAERITDQADFVMLKPYTLSQLTSLLNRLLARQSHS
jgi:DNA-binding response OmpR family regulator